MQSTEGSMCKLNTNITKQLGIVGRKITVMVKILGEKFTYG